jgi:hypothetical protein
MRPAMLLTCPAVHMFTAAFYVQQRRGKIDRSDITTAPNVMQEIACVMEVSFIMSH